MMVNTPVVNTRTRTIHMGRVTKEKRIVKSVLCGKPVGDHYTEATGYLLTCAVCKTKLVGKQVGFRPRRRRPRC